MYELYDYWNYVRLRCDYIHSSDYSDKVIKRLGWSLIYVILMTVNIICVRQLFKHSKFLYFIFIEKWK